jgi:hypothetical protein
MPNRFLISLIAALITVLPGANAFAMTAEQYFEDGNRLFRDDLYWAALLRYRQAAEEGMDSPLLHYNTGIAHYRARQHVDAREALLKALDEPRLVVAAQYNLGLNAHALGETDEALRWFRLVRDQQENQKLRQMALVAIGRIGDARNQPDEFDRQMAERKKKREFAKLELRARVSFGTDDNVFRSPDRPYIDYSDPTLPVVVPVVQSGVYMPVSLSAKYFVNSLPFEGFFGAYRLSGRYYQDKELDSANEFLHEASFGSEYKRRESSRERRVYSAFKVAQHDEVYFDPDTGEPRTAEDRMNYVRFGPELALRQSHEQVSFGFRGKAQLWNYETTEAAPEYDHEYFLASTYLQYKFTRTSLVRLTADYYSRRYSDRPSFDLDGEQRIGNPAIRYDYVAATLRARQRILDDMWFGLEVQRSQRTDRYVGYNDYTRDSFGAELHWSPGRRFDLEARALYRLYDFPNAFAFHNPVAGRKTQESLDGNIIVTYRMTPRLSFVAEATFRETVSNDIRIQYDRNQYVIGVRWEQ